MTTTLTANHRGTETQRTTSKALEVKKVVVLGAGTMGAQVAAHLVACGCEVVLLDMVPAGAADRSVLAKRALETLRKLKPSPLHLPEHAARIQPGNFEDDWTQLKDADWVFEAVVEDLEIKKQLFARVAPAVKKTAIVTSNTSGLGIDALSAPLPADVRKRFFGTHFFNPPRYLKLLETIPGSATDPALLQAFEAFADRVVGKGVVRCKDTPNFIGNRIGSYGFGVVLRAMQEQDLTVEEVDALTGPAIGRAKSASFRTADIAGIDICVKVSENLYAAAVNDPERDVFQVPAFMKTMVAKGLLGEKAGAGFYKKDGKEILHLDWKTLEYRPRQKPKFPALEAAQNLPDPAARLRAIVASQDKAGQFLWRVLSSVSFYAAACLGEIADEIASIDHAMEWGYGWGSGPFRTLDALGVQATRDRARAEGRAIPSAIETLLASGRKSFYEGEGTEAPRPGTVSIAALKEAGAVKKKNAGASLVDLGDGCGLVEFHSKMNSLGNDTFAMLKAAVGEGRAHFDALVVGNQAENFTVGANLMLVLLAAQEEEWDELELGIRQFQNANMALKYAEIPVVVAPFGLTLGGGCEIALHGARVVLAAETYMGLVEAGVGLVPGGGGCKEMALRALDRAAGVEGADPFPFVRAAFENIALAKVAGSGFLARQRFLSPADVVCLNPDRLILDAKALALGLAHAGHRPGRPRTDVPVLGRSAIAAFKAGIHNMLRGGFISEHDATVGAKVATILCGGDREAGVTTEQHLLDLEREAFLSLLGTKKTLERIQHTLKTGKPLRN